MHAGLMRVREEGGGRGGGGIIDCLLFKYISGIYISVFY